MSKAETIVDNFLTGLKAWVNSAAPEERESRNEAMLRMIEVRHSGSDHLSLYGLRLSSIPEQIGDLTGLRSLNLSSNQLGTLPEGIRYLTALENLGFSSNQLETLPEWIGDFTALESLDLEENQLETVPRWIGDLAALKRLYLDSNRLTTLSDSLLNSPTRNCTISLEGNLIDAKEACRISRLALVGGVTLGISISIGDKILSNAPEEKKEKLKALLDDSNSELHCFKRFLEKCQHTEGWKSREPEMTQCLLEILDKMSESEVVKIKCITLAKMALDTCADRVALAFVHMQLVLNLSDKELKDMSLQEVYDYARQESVIKFLFDKSQAKINDIKNSESVPDEIETHLAYLQIAQELGLNLRANGMLYQGCSNVTGEDLQSAIEDFRALDRDLLTAKHLCEDEMLRMHPFVQEIITEISSKEEFSVEKKKVIILKKKVRILRDFKQE